jgi:ribonuclease D
MMINKKWRKIIVTIFKNDIPEDLKIEDSIAIDTEAMGLNIHRDRLCTVQFCDSASNGYIVQFTSKKYNAPNLVKLLSDKNCVKIFHFARFDVAIMEYYLGLKIENIFCTKIASKLVRTYTDSHGLKELCRELLNIQISKQQQSSYWGIDELSNDQKEYAIKDVLYLHQLRDALTTMLIRENRMEIAQQLFDFLPVRARLDIMGWNEMDIFSHGAQ